MPSLGSQLEFVIFVNDMATLEREKLIGLLVAMLEKRGPGMVAELERRVAAGQPLEVRGICLDVSMQQEALSKFKSANARSRSRTPPREPHPEDDSPPSSLANSASPAEAKVEPKAASPKKAGTRWIPGGSSASGARWKPGAPSASLLAAKALMECEAAESFSRSVQVVGDQQVSLLTRPDMHSDLTGTHLSKGQIVEVVARFVCQRDGRVYVRLRMQEGWASTRSKDDWSKEVLGPVAGESPIEPARIKNRITSTAMRLLPEVAPEAVTIAESAEGATEPAAEDGGADEDEEDGVEEDAVDAEAGDEGEEGDEDLGEEEEGEHGEDDKDAGQGDEMEAEADDMEGDADDDSEEVEGSASAERSKSAKRRHVRKFRVVVGRCPILSAPNAKELMGFTRGKEALLMKDQAHCDGYTFVKPEQRVYLRLTRHRGWIAERSRTDIWRFAVLPITYRSKPLSKKAARRVAFHGGDASEHTKLRSDDLVKNAYGKIVSKKASEAAKKRSAQTIGKWTTAVKQAREELNLTGFVAVKKGTPVYTRAQEIYAESKKK